MLYNWIFGIIHVPRNGSLEIGSLVIFGNATISKVFFSKIVNIQQLLLAVVAGS